jgi:hypothetical protein
MISLYDYLKNNNFDFLSLKHKKLKFGLAHQCNGTVIELGNDFVKVKWLTSIDSGWENTYYKNKIGNYIDQPYWIDEKVDEEELKHIKVKTSLYNSLLKHKNQLMDIGIYLE